VGLDLEATRQRIADNVEQAIAETRASLAHAERQRALAEERVARVKADYVDGRIDAAEWRELSGDLLAGRDAAASEVERLAARVEEVAGQRALLDSEHELLEQLAELRRAVAGRLTDSTSVEGMRAALLRLFDGFTLHPFDEPEHAPALPDGWVRSALYTHPELMPAGVGLIVEPHPRREMILDDDKEIAFPQLRRVPLEARVRMQVSGTMNLCPCGGRGDAAVGCACSAPRLASFRQKLSRALLDRFDLVLAMPRLRGHELSSGSPESSEAVRERVQAARTLLAAEEPPPTEPATALLDRAVDTLGLSGRGRARVARVAVTVAALAASAETCPAHVAEALSYRAPAELTAP